MSLLQPLGTLAVSHARGVRYFVAVIASIAFLVPASAANRINVAPTAPPGCDSALARSNVYAAGEMIAQQLATEITNSTAIRSQEEIAGDFVDRLRSIGDGAGYDSFEAHNVAQALWSRSLPRENGDRPAEYAGRTSVATQIKTCFPVLARILDASAAPLNRPNCPDVLTLPQIQAVAQKFAEPSLRGGQVSSLGAGGAGHLLSQFKLMLSMLIRTGADIAVGRLSVGRISLPSEESRQAALRALETLQVSDAAACFPDLAPALRIGIERDQKREAEQRARQEAAAAAAQRAQQENDDLIHKRVSVDKLEREIGVAYAYYITIKRCFEAREGYLEINISEAELARAKDEVTRLEQNIRTPEMNLDVIWSMANSFVAQKVLHPGFQPNRGLCQLSLMKLDRAFSKWFPAGVEIKKDF